MTVKEIIDNVGGGYKLTINIYSLVIYNGVPTEVLVANMNDTILNNFEFDTSLEAEDYDVTYVNENTKEMSLDIYIKSKGVEIINE